MTVREIPVEVLGVRGLVAAKRVGSSIEPPQSTAGIFSLREKEGDPRLAPLTPEQIEAGLDDENVADALPPDPPARYGLRFRQPVVVQVEGARGSAGVGGALSAIGSFWRRLFSRGGPGQSTRAALRVSLKIDEATAREVYRSLVPGERFIVLPPPGLLLPEAGQEPPHSIRPAGPAPRPTPVPAAPPGVPFRIPPPVEADQNGAPAAVPGVSPEPAAPGSAPQTPESPPAPAAPAQAEPPSSSASVPRSACLSGSRATS